MKQAKIMPCGKCSPCGLSAGVHRKTKVYMLPSNSDCIAPSSAIFWSAEARWTLKDSHTFTLRIICSTRGCTLSFSNLHFMHKVAAGLIMVVGCMLASSS